MSKMRGKKLHSIKPQANYAKVPMSILCHQNLTPVDKLIFAYLYSLPGNGSYTLAYTRIAKELHIDKSNLIKRWTWFFEKGYIKEDDNNYYLIIGAEDKLNEINKSVPTPHIHDGLNGSTIPPINNDQEVGRNDQPGGLKPSTQVASHDLDGSPIHPNDNNKEEKIKTEHGVKGRISFPEEKSDLDKSRKNHTSNLDNNTSNDLDFLLNNSSIFKSTFEHNISIGNYWNGIDIGKYSNIYIAYLIGQRVKSEPIDIPKNVQNMLTIMVKFSQKYPDSNLWKCFLSEIGNDANYIKKLDEY